MRKPYIVKVKDFTVILDVDVYYPWVENDRLVEAFWEDGTKLDMDELREIEELNPEFIKILKEEQRI